MAFNARSSEKWSERVAEILSAKTESLRTVAFLLLQIAQLLLVIKFSAKCATPQNLGSSLQFVCTHCGK